MLRPARAWSRAATDKEVENYAFNEFEPIVFVWKHKIEQPCSNYVASIFAWDCRVGKPRPGPTRFRFENIRYGPIDPDPIIPERIFTFTAPPGAIVGGRYDWVA